MVEHFSTRTRGLLAVFVFLVVLVAGLAFIFLALLTLRFVLVHELLPGRFEESFVLLRVAA